MCSRTFTRTVFNTTLLFPQDVYTLFHTQKMRSEVLTGCRYYQYKHILECQEHIWFVLLFFKWC